MSLTVVGSIAFDAVETEAGKRDRLLGGAAEHVPGGKTFFWAGRYERDVNIRHTLQTDLNVFETFQPKLSQASKDADVLFLANIQPDLQRAVREQCPDARFVALDTMNLWIDIARDSLVRTIKT